MPPPAGQQQPGTGHRGVADVDGRKAPSQTGGLVQELFLPSGQLEDGAAGGRGSGVPLWRVVPTGRVHRNESGR